jgi:hypothetical protein
MLLSDHLARGSHLGVLSAGCPGAWDMPYTISPGTERLSGWCDGLPTAGPAVPEALLLTLTPLAIESMLLLAPDPYLDPLAAGRDGLLWGRAIRLEEETPRSAVRLTEGPGQSATEDAVIGRRSGPVGWSATYAHGRSAGRPAWVRPRYERTRFQNLGIHLDRSTPLGACALEASDRTGQIDLEDRGKLVWEARRLTGGWQFVAPSAVRGELRAGRSNDLLAWWDSDGRSLRRTTSTDAALRLAAGSESTTVVLAAGIERVALRFELAGRSVLNGPRTGSGLAMGGSLRRGRGVLAATAGWTAPWWGEGHARAHAWGLMEGPSGLAAEVEGWIGSDAPFVPRAEGDGAALIEEGLLLPGGGEARAGPLRRVAHAEARLRAGRGARSLAIGCFARRLSGALGLDASGAADLAPAERDTLGFAALSGGGSLSGVRASLRLALPLSARLEGDAQALVSPARDPLPVLTARHWGRGRFAIGRYLFRRDLRVEGRLDVQWRGAWRTPYGESAGGARWDAEFHGTKGRAHFFFALRHLGNDAQDSGTHAGGAWMPLPYRSSQIGVEWHFLD